MRLAAVLAIFGTLIIAGAHPAASSAAGFFPFGVVRNVQEQPCTGCQFMVQWPDGVVWSEPSNAPIYSLTVCARDWSLGWSSWCGNHPSTTRGYNGNMGRVPGNTGNIKVWGRQPCSGGGFHNSSTRVYTVTNLSASVWLDFATLHTNAIPGCQI